MATLQFKGKNIIWNHHMSVPYHTLDLDEKLSYKQDKADGNLIIEGDNLPALKSLLPQYTGKIDCIYIDPPYNTGNESWVYNDNVNSPLVKEWIGKEVGSDDLTRHDKWLSMMTPRLKLLKELLSDIGLIFVSIDDNEVHHLRNLMDEIFGEENFLAQLTIETGEVFGSKASHTDKTFVKVKDYVVIYKSSLGTSAKRTPLYDSMKELFDTHYNTIILKNLERTSLIDYLQNIAWIKELFERYQIELKIENINKVMLLDDKFRKFINEELSQILYTNQPYTSKIPKELKRKLDENEIAEKEHLILYKTKTGSVRYYQSFADSVHQTDDYFSSYNRASIRGDLWKSFHYDMRNIDDEGETLFKNGKKPTRLLKQLFKWANNGSRLTVLDAFAGSGTTAQAVLELNEEDEGNRKFILIQMPENSEKEPNKNIARDITRERVVKVIENKLQNKDVGFEYRRVGQPIDAETILSGQLPTYKQLAKYVYYLATGQSPKDKDVDEKKYLAGKVDHTEVYLLYTPDMDELKKMAITFEWAKEVSEGNENKKIVYAPACFMDEEYLDQFNMKFVSIPYNLFEREQE